MIGLPRAAKIYVTTTIATGGLIAAAVWARRLAPLAGREWELLLFLLLAILAGGKKLHLVRNRTDSDMGSLSIGFAVTFAAMIQFGPAGALPVAVAGSLSSCLYPTRQKLHQLFFNLALTVICTWAASSVFLALNRGTLALRSYDSFPAVATACLVFYLANTVGVSAAIGLSAGRRVVDVWTEVYLLTAPSYFVAAVAGTVASLVMGRHAAPILLCGSPIVYLTYKSYALFSARENANLQQIEELEVSQAELADLYLSTVKSLALAIDAKDKFTQHHIIRVQRYAVATARKLGLAPPDFEAVKAGALLHDIGMLGVPDHILRKPGALTEEEYAKVKEHTQIGAAILEPVNFPWPVVQAVRHHHEKWDGSGYPDGLRGENIPVPARVLTIADVYDSLTSGRPYRPAIKHEQAMRILQADAGKHFDPVALEAFNAVIDGVLAELATEGMGPLSVRSAVAGRGTDVAQDIQRASSELWMLYELSQSLAASAGLQSTVELLASKLEDFFPGSVCAVLVKECTDEETRLQVRAASGTQPGALIGWRAAQAGRPSIEAMTRQAAYLGGFDPEDLRAERPELTVDLAFRSALIVPIIHEAEAIGTLNLYRAGSGAFSSGERQLLETIAQRAASGMHNALQFDLTRTDAYTDPLTGLFNVRYFMRYIQQRCAAGLEPQPEKPHTPETSKPDRRQAHTGGFALLCLDLDSFKPINDNFGHQKGDQVLRDLAGIFRATLREQDVVARYGGDEFLIALDGADRGGAAIAVERLLKAVDAYDPGAHHPKLGALRVGVSIGYACFPQDGEDGEHLLAAADSNMYTAKADRKRVFRPLQRAA